MAHRIFYSWRTTKTDNGFAAIVTKNQTTSEAQPNGRYCITTEIARVEGFRSRACAKTHAHKLVRYHKAQSN